MSDNKYSILSKIYSILMENNLLVNQEQVPVIRYEPPQKLIEIFDNFECNNDEPTSDDEILKILSKVVKYSVNPCHPHYHNEFFAGPDPYALAAAWLSEAINSCQYTYEVAPVFTMVERAMVENGLKTFGYDDGDGIFAAGGSMGNMFGIILARYHKFPEIKTLGISGFPQLIAFTSEDSHYSFRKSMSLLGIGSDNLMLVRTNHSGQMIVEDLELKVQSALDQGKVPFFVNATSGTTVLGSFDSIDEIADVCEKYQIWLHVDACLGGAAMYSKSYQHLMHGVERSDSVVWNPVKIIGIPHQCTVFLTKQKDYLLECNSASAAYLFQSDKHYDTSYDSGDKSIQCSRKVDAFKLYLLFKGHGRLELEEMIDNALDMSKYFAQKISNRPGFRLVIDNFEFTNVCFWYIPKCMRNMEENDDWWNYLFKVASLIKDRMVKSGGQLTISYSPLRHRGLGNFFRMITNCHPRPTYAEMDYVIEEIEKFGELLHDFD